MLHSAGGALQPVVTDPLTDTSVAETVSTGQKSRYMVTIFFEVFKANWTGECLRQTIHIASHFSWKIFSDSDLTLNEGELL